MSNYDVAKPNPTSQNQRVEVNAYVSTGAGLQSSQPLDAPEKTEPSLSPEFRGEGGVQVTVPNKKGEPMVTLFVGGGFQGSVGEGSFQVRDFFQGSTFDYCDKETCPQSGQPTTGIIRGVGDHKAKTVGDVTQGPKAHGVLGGRFHIPLGKARPRPLSAGGYLIAGAIRNRFSGRTALTADTANAFEMLLEPASSTDQEHSWQTWRPFLGGGLVLDLDLTEAAKFRWNRLGLGLRTFFEVNISLASDAQEPKFIKDGREKIGDLTPRLDPQDREYKPEEMGKSALPPVLQLSGGVALYFKFNLQKKP